MTHVPPNFMKSARQAQASRTGNLRKNESLKEADSHGPGGTGGPVGLRGTQERLRDPATRRALLSREKAGDGGCADQAPGGMDEYRYICARRGETLLVRSF